MVTYPAEEGGRGNSKPLKKRTKESVAENRKDGQKKGRRGKAMQDLVLQEGSRKKVTERWMEGIDEKYKMEVKGDGRGDGGRRVKRGATCC